MLPKMVVMSAESCSSFYSLTLHTCMLHVHVHEGLHGLTHNFVFCGLVQHYSTINYLKIQ